MMWLKLLTFAYLIVASAQYGSAYTSMAKDNIFADVLLTELLSRMDKEGDSVNNYFDMDTEIPTSSKGLDMVSRASKSNMPDDFEYHSLSPYGRGGGGASSNPSIRDQEFLQHSSLWGHHYISGGMGEMPNRFHTIVKTDASLPAYCNPPNPCPVGYKESEGCITDFDNTAIFSREFQAAQDCTCDNEHMFDCAAQENNDNANEMTSTMEKFLMHQFQNENGIDANSNGGIVKKFYSEEQKKSLENPFLQGDKLPIAAKKGDHIKI